MSSIAIRYARALASGIGPDTAALARAKTELAALANAMTSEAARTFFENPRVSRDKKMTVIESVLGKKMSSELLHFAKLVVLHGRESELPRITTRFSLVADRLAGVASARVLSAKKMTAKEETDLAKELEKMTSKTIYIETATDASLLAGIKVYLGDEVIDLSLAGKLQKLAAEVA